MKKIIKKKKSKKTKKKRDRETCLSWSALAGGSGETRTGHPRVTADSCGSVFPGRQVQAPENFVSLSGDWDFRAELNDTGRESRHDRLSEGGEEREEAL